LATPGADGRSATPIPALVPDLAPISTVGLHRSPAVRAALRREVRLRRTVRRYGACLPHLPRAERRVLLLRANGPRGGTRSRTRVARITGLSRRRVARLEHAGLHHLRTLAHANVCQENAAAASGGGGTVIPAGAFSGPAAAQGLATTAELADTFKATSLHPGRDARALSTSPDRREGGRPTTTDLTFLALLFVGAAAVAVMVREVRRGGRPVA
jgi:hypothetical protein